MHFPNGLTDAFSQASLRQKYTTSSRQIENNIMSMILEFDHTQHERFIHQTMADSTYVMGG